MAVLTDFTLLIFGDSNYLGTKMIESSFSCDAESNPSGNRSAGVLQSGVISQHGQ